jgi:hypothetical protein
MCYPHHSCGYHVSNVHYYMRMKNGEIVVCNVEEMERYINKQGLSCSKARDKYHRGLAVLIDSS